MPTVCGQLASLIGDSCRFMSTWCFSTFPTVFRPLVRRAVYEHADEFADMLSIYYVDPPG